MTTAQLAKRLTALEKVVEALQAKVSRVADPCRPWWIEDAGRFAGDSDFEEIVRLGRQYRESLQPRRRKVSRAHS